jgi:uncharacterized LabA/DUF88 family protein
MPGMPQKYRVIAYIDGYNLYYGIRDQSWQRYLWLDLRGLSGSLLRQDQDLIETKYFTTRISSPEAKRKRQSDYLEALQAHCGTSLKMFFGHYQSEPWKCAHCNQVVPVSHEKKTDVNIAVEMMADAFQDAFDTALLISADSDLVPVVLALRRLFPKKSILVAFPPARASVELKNEANACITIGRAKLAGSQLPETVMKFDGRPLTRPAKWNPTPPTIFGAKLMSALDDVKPATPKR